MTRRAVKFAPVLIGAAALALAGCKAAPVAEAPPAAAELPVAVTAPQLAPEPPQEAAAVTEPAETCDVLESRDWAAWVNRMPGPGAVPKVHVTGKVDVRTSGYTFTWQEGPMDRSAVPALRLKLVPAAPGGMAAQVITTEEVKYEAPALAAGFSRVIVSCGGATLAEITEIPDVQ